MKTTKSIAVTAVWYFGLISGAVLAGGYPTNPERDVIDQSLGAQASTRGNIMADSDVSADGWQEVGGERGVKFVGRVSAAGGDSHAFTKEDMMQARIDYRNAP